MTFDTYYFFLANSLIYHLDDWMNPPID